MPFPPIVCARRRPTARHDMNLADPLPPLVQDLSLAYRLSATPQPPTGLLLLMHGVGSNESSMAAFTRLVPPHVAVALVRSPFSMGPGAFAAFTVNFTAQGPVIDSAAAEDCRQRLIRFVGELQTRTGIGAERTLIAGFSQGGVMSASLALTRPDLVAGFAILSGRILPDIAPHIATPGALARLDALIVHGEQDDRLPVHFAEQSAALLREHGVRFADRRHQAGHEITAPMAQDFIDWVGGRLP